MNIVECDICCVDQLARMNKQLIDDEKSDNPMNIEQLTERMESFLNNDYHAYYFMIDDDVIGYALVRYTSKPYYLRQFLIDRKYRRNHYGKEAFQALLQYLEVDRIDLEVLPWNEIGMRFWESCGFKEISKYLRYTKEE